MTRSHNPVGPSESRTIDTRLLDGIRRLQDDRQTGILTLGNTSDERVEIILREGLIDAVSAPRVNQGSYLSAHRFGHYLVESGWVSVSELKALHAEALRSRTVLGETAVGRQLMDAPEVGVLVRRQAVDLVRHVLGSGFSLTSFALTPRTLGIPAGLTFAQLQLELLRASAEPFSLELDVPIVLSNGDDLSAFPWYPEELAVLNELRRPIQFSSLIEATGLTESRLNRILGVLDRLGIIETIIVGSQDPAGAEGDASTPENVEVPEWPLERLIPVTTNAMLEEKLEITLARNGPSFTSEQFKSLKVQIREAYTDAPLKVLAVSSPDAGAGKSLVASTLAMSLATEPNRRILLIDCDLRIPAVGRYLGIPEEPGLLQYVEEPKLDPYCFLRRVDNLYVLASGGIAGNPIEVLSMKKMADLVEKLKEDFDTVILDSPPYSPIADARVVTGLADALVLVIRRGRSSYGNTDRAFAAIDSRKLLGVVFNDVKPMMFNTQSEYGYYSPYGQYAKEGYGVYADAEGKTRVKRPSRPKTYLDP